MILNIPILLYHRITEPEPNTSLCVAPIDFDKHMEYLYNQGYNVVSLDQVIKYFKKEKRLKKKTIVLTFDDGYQDFATNAYPILNNYGFNATVFLVTDCVGKTNVWDHKDGWPKAGLMSWETIKELSEKGISFGSHGKTHKYIGKMRSIKKLIGEIKSSKKKIENAIGKSAKCFSYSYSTKNKLIQLHITINGYTLTSYSYR